MERYRQNNMRMSGNAMHSHMSSSLCRCGEAGFSAVKQCTGLAMARIENQVWQNIYPTEKAIRRGTVFAELDLPFTAAKGGGKC